MLKARIRIDLPGEDVLRARGPIEWVRSLFGETFDLRTGEVRTTMGAVGLLAGLYNAFTRAGVHDAVSLLVDRKAIYVDTEGVTHDLSAVWQAAKERRMLDRPFREMHLVLTHREAGIHLLYDVRVTERVMEGDPHVVVTISGRPEDLRIRRGESAPEYAMRVRELTRNDAGVEAYRAALDTITSTLAHALEETVQGASATVEQSRIELVRPGARELGRFRKLQFGRDVIEAKYRPAPTHARKGAYADPFVYYWYDPYWDFTTWILLDAMVHHGAWAAPDVAIVDPEGRRLDRSAATSGDAGSVTVADQGVSVDPTIPDTAGPDLASDDPLAGDTGWSDGGGSVDGAGGDFGGGDSGGGGAGSSTCGSSCSSSSCGSSCGGGGCGGGCG